MFANYAPWRWLLLGALLLLSLVLASCNAGGSDMPIGADDPALLESDINLIAYDGSDWQEREVSAVLEPQDDGYALSLSSSAALPAENLLLELHFPEEYSAEITSNDIPAGGLQLIVSGRPGILAVGALLADGKLVQPGEFLTARLMRSGLPQRSANRVPVGEAGQVQDLAGIEDDLGAFNLSWSYRNRGDYDQNKQANIADLTPLGGRMQESAIDGERDGLDGVLDGDGNGEVNIADLTPLGANFLSIIDGYRVYRSSSADVESNPGTEVAEIAFDASTLATDSRRQFAASLTDLQLAPGEYYYVRPFDSAGEETGAASNPVLFEGLSNLRFRRAPSGDHIVDAAAGQNPSVVLMPAIPELSQQDAPAIVYTQVGESGSPLMLAYYSPEGWVSENIGGGDSYSLPQALWFSEEEGAGYPLVCVYNVTSLEFEELTFSADWVLQSSRSIGNGSGAPVHAALDFDAANNELGLAHGYLDGEGGSIEYSSSVGGGAWVTNNVYTGDSVGGLDFAFDPSGAEPWLIFTHGTISTQGTITIDFTLEQSRLNGGTWTTTEIPHPDSPLVVDLNFREDGTPQLACTAARDYTVQIPLQDPITLSLLFDIVAGEYSSGFWTLGRAYESSLGISLGGGFPPDTLEIELALATDVSWGQADELIYSGNAGTISVDIISQVPQGGGLDSSSQYLRREALLFYSESGYYDGAAGRAYSWVLPQSGNPACAYVRSGTLLAEDVVTGEFGLAGELAYWQP